MHIVQGQMGTRTHHATTRRVGPDSSVERRARETSGLTCRSQQDTMDAQTDVVLCHSDGQYSCGAPPHTQQPTVFSVNSW